MERIKRYYSIIDLKDDQSDRMGDSRLFKLFNFVNEKKIDILQGSAYKEDLQKNGIIIINNSFTIYTFIYPSDIIEDSDEFYELEQQIIDFAYDKTCLLVEEIKARLNHEYIIKRIHAKHLYLTEDVLIPDGSTSFEAHIITYLNNLSLKDNTLIITDPYLFPKSNDSTYEIQLKNILSASSAKKIIVYIPLSNLNSVLFNSIKTHLNSCDIELAHKDKDNYHDRFWICIKNKKGFVMGTSLNGIGRKVCRVDNLYEEEVDAILGDLC